MKLAPIVVLILAANLSAQTVTLPSSVKGNPGEFVTVPATTSGKVVQWFACDVGLNLFPTELLKDTKTAVVIGQKPGRYRLLAWTALGDVPSPPAVCIVVIGDAPEPEPPPKPDPKPKPDPEPNDPIWPALKDAWGYEDAATKKAHREIMYAFFLEVAQLARTAQLKTVAEFVQKLAITRQEILGDKLPRVQAVFRMETQKALTNDPAALLEPNRQVIFDHYNRYARLLTRLP